MKLPRLSNPKTTLHGNITVTQSSIFDHMPAWGQWCVVAISILPIILILVCLHLQKIGVLK